MTGERNYNAIIGHFDDRVRKNGYPPAYVLLSRRLTLGDVHYTVSLFFTSDFPEHWHLSNPPDLAALKVFADELVSHREFTEMPLPTPFALPGEAKFYVHNSRMDEYQQRMKSLANA